MASRWPYYPLSLKGSVKGNLQSLSFSGVQAVLPTAFSVKADGKLANLLDMDRLKADVNLDAKTYNLGFVTCMLDPSLMREIRVPSGIGIRGNVKADGNKYATKLAVTEGKGRLNLQARSLFLYR